MPALSIPKSERHGLAILRGMTDAVFSSFLQAIENRPHSIPVIPETTPEAAELAKEASDSMYSVRAYNDVSVEQFIDDIFASLRSHKELEVADEPAFRDRLNRLLNIETLLLAAKATVLRQVHERNLCSIRVITDARPVYANGPSVPPAAMVITHTMKIEYHQGVSGDLRELYISFESEDIAEILAAFTRAEEKARSLRSLFSVAKVKFIDSLEREGEV